MTMTATRPETTAQVTKTAEQRPRRFDPFELFDEAQQDMARLWSQAFPLMPRPWRRTMLAPSTWLPAADVFEKDGSLVIKAELPGLTKEDIDITLEQGDLVLKGERHAESEVKEAHYYRVERSYGGFYRRIPLDFEVTAEQIQAKYSDGVLEVQIPKPAQAQPKVEKIALQ